jgi:hypothetical protein
VPKQARIDLCGEPAPQIQVLYCGGEDDEEVEEGVCVHAGHGRGVEGQGACVCVVWVFGGKGELW